MNVKVYLEPFFESSLEKGLPIILILLGSIVSYIITKKIIISLIEKLISKTSSTWDDMLVKNKVLTRLAYLTPALVIHIFSNILFDSTSKLIMFLSDAILAYMLIITSLVISACLNSALDILKHSNWAKNIPIRSYIQVIKLILFLITTIFVLSIMLDKSPWAFLSGLGAMTAIILLVFKDTILSFVAGIQLSANNLVKQGDWIEMPKYGADGDVIDVSLNTIKVQNWDKTISSIPVYALASESFKNWRGMTESGGRRIKKSIMLDLSSIRFCTASDLSNWQKNTLLDPVLSDVKLENIGLETNSSLFRKYVFNYVKSHDQIHDNMTCLVRYLQPTDKGLPLEVYIFSKDQEWANYENIQAEILEHIIASAPLFDLHIFQSPSNLTFKETLTNLK